MIDNITLQISMNVILVHAKMEVPVMILSMDIVVNASLVTMDPPVTWVSKMEMRLSCIHLVAQIKL